MNSKKYPVYEPVIGEEDIQAVVTALRAGEISGTYGKALIQFEEWFASYCGCKYGVATTSGTTALHLAVAVAGVSCCDDEVLVSASTNIATALAVVHNGGIPIPVDSEDITWNLNLELIKGLITEQTKAIIPVHLFGHPVDMDRLMDIAKQHNLMVIEDAAEAHGATCRKRKVGSFGDMGCFSFYANKIITTGEGGMVVTNDVKLYKKLRLLRNLGFTEPRFRHEEAGFNFRMTNYQAAMGVSQLKKIARIISEKRRVAHTYINYLHDVEGLQLPAEMDWAFNVYWMFGIVVQPEFGISRDELMKRLAEEGIDTRTFFCPMNQQPVLYHYGMPEIDCPVADSLWENGLYLPSSYTLSEEDIGHIARSIEIVNLEVRR